MAGKLANSAIADDQTSTTSGVLGKIALSLLEAASLTSRRLANGGSEAVCWGEEVFRVPLFIRIIGFVLVDTGRSH